MASTIGISGRKAERLLDEVEELISGITTDQLQRRIGEVGEPQP